MTTEKMTVELIEEAEVAPEPGNFDRRQVIHSSSDVFPMEVQLSSLESAGYVYVYDTKTGSRSVVNRNMLETQLSNLRPDGTRFFTTVKPAFEPKRGTLKCLLHKDDPDRGQYDSWGFATCSKSNLISEFQVNRHVQIRHRMEWQTIYDERDGRRKKKSEPSSASSSASQPKRGRRPKAQDPVTPVQPSTTPPVDVVDKSEKDT